MPCPSTESLSQHLTPNSLATPAPKVLCSSLPMCDEKPLIKEILSLKPEGQLVTVRGWVRTKRETKNLIFLQVNDGSCLSSIQVTFLQEGDAALSSVLKQITTGASVIAEGALVASPASGQAVELQGKSIKIIGEAPAESYPLQKKKHTFEFLRTIAHLRPRTNTFGAVTRMRSQMAFAIHTFFQERGFQYVHTPIITASDCEGAGEMFRVTTLDPQQIAKDAYAAGKEGRPLEETSAFPGWDADFLARRQASLFLGSLRLKLTRLRSRASTLLARHSARKTQTPRATSPSSGWSSQRWPSLTLPTTWTLRRRLSST